MNIASAILLWLVLWFLMLFVVLPLRLKTQSEDGEIVPGTPPSSPSNLNLKRKVLWVTLLATAIWIPVVLTIINGWITISDLEYFRKP